jgi:hypothetical protein
MIPKAGGGERPLGIPTIRDRVVQTAAKLVLEPILEADLDPAAYGYRPERSAGQAIQLVLTLLRQGYIDVVDADLSKYFDTIPHQELMQTLARRIVDGDMLRLIKGLQSLEPPDTTLRRLTRIPQRREVRQKARRSGLAHGNLGMRGPPLNRILGRAGIPLLFKRLPLSVRRQGLPLARINGII